MELIKHTGTNKCQFVINGMSGELVRMQRFLSSELGFLFRGHTKVEPDRVFANITTTMMGEDCFNLLYV